MILGVLDLADPAAESAQQVADRLQRALGFIDARRLIAGPDCGMKYLPRQTAFKKLQALADGARIVRERMQ